MMGAISDGIDRVRVFALAAGVAVDGSAVHEPMHAMVVWRSSHADKLHQVYVNGRLAGVTHDCGERRLVIGLLSSWTAGLRVEVFAVPPGEAHADLGGSLESQQSQGRVEVGWLRRTGLPFGGAVRVYSNGGDGEIDYGPAASEAIEVWPVWQDQGGFGMSRFGSSDFGYDGSAAVGFGCGLFGEGEFGFDADAMRWVSGELEDGVYRFGVKVADAFGNESGGLESGEVVVVRKAGGVGEIVIESYDKGSGELVIGMG